MTAAIYYHPEAYTTNGPKLMGRNAAGESFLRGFLTHSQSKEFWAQVQNMDHAKHFAQTVQSFARPEPVKAVDKNSMPALAEVGMVYYPGPGIGEHAFHRALAGAAGVAGKSTNPHTAWSLCGITHTTSSAGAMDALANLITAPVQPWDAVICTSTAVKNNVERLLQAQVNYLQERLGVSKLSLPLLPVIPLGIHTQDFVFSDLQKSEARQAIGADSNTLVVLFMGRLSFHAKAHPLAMYQALQKASQSAKLQGQKVVLVECGWHANVFIDKAYQEAAKLACPDVRVITLDGRKASDRETAWASADVFCSLSDNIQETFGIVPIEAMAAGLPVVVSDWDGYKDTVRHEVDGFRIPTTMPAAGLAGDLAYRHALGIDNYDMYCGNTCSLIAVDIEAAALAFQKLFASKELRARMGSDGRARAQQVYDWRVIIAQYEGLWAEQERLRIAAQEASRPVNSDKVNLLNTALWPARLDPFYAFGSYSTFTYSDNDLIGLVHSDVNMTLSLMNTYSKLKMINYAAYVLPPIDLANKIIMIVSSQPLTVEKLFNQFNTENKQQINRHLYWLIKYGVLKIAR
jgi:glycosyltransferase involved in cell wall biosynthesis